MNATTPARWMQSTWQDEVIAWARSALQASGRDILGWTQPHVRPWSTVFRLETADGPVWLKANGPGTRHEAPLLAQFAHDGLPMTPRPLAIDAGLAVALLPDGGLTIREAGGGTASIERMAAVLEAYGHLQRESALHIDALLLAGVPDVRPERMPGLLEELLDEVDRRGFAGHRLPVDAVSALRAILPEYSRACEELAGAGVAPTIQHDDLHSANVFDRGSVVFDWGDAIVGHPFGTLLAALNSMAHAHALAPDDPALRTLADAATDAWSDDLSSRERRHLMDLALRTGPLTRALSWRRALDGADAQARAEWGDAVCGWLDAVLDPDLPLKPPLLTR